MTRHLATARRAIAALALGALALSACGLLGKAKGTVGATLSDQIPQEVKQTARATKKVVQAFQDLRKELSPENEYYVGRSVATNILAKYAYDYRDAEAIAAGKLDGVTAYVNQVGAIVTASALEAPRGDDRPAPLAGWHFVVIEGKEPNAFAAPGGFVFVTSGTLRALRTEDELASVLAHEVAHIVRGHALGTIKKARYANVGKELFDATARLAPEELAKVTKLFEESMDDMLDSLLVKGYSRETELEADALGVTIAARAGYAPSSMLAILKTLDKGEAAGGYKSTHPSSADRIAALEPKLAELGGAKEAAKARTKRFKAAMEAL